MPRILTVVACTVCVLPLHAQEITLRLSSVRFAATATTMQFTQAPRFPIGMVGAGVRNVRVRAFPGTLADLTRPSRYSDKDGCAELTAFVFNATVVNTQLLLSASKFEPLWLHHEKTPAKDEFEAKEWVLVLEDASISLPEEPGRIRLARGSKDAYFSNALRLVVQPPTVLTPELIAEKVVAGVGQGSVVSGLRSINKCFSIDGSAPGRELLIAGECHASALVP